MGGSVFLAIGGSVYVSAEAINDIILNKIKTKHPINLVTTSALFQAHSWIGKYCPVCWFVTF